MSVFVAVDIGCIECGEGTEIIGIFRTREGADAAAAKRAKQEPELSEWGYTFFTGGQHSAEVFEAEVPA